MLRDQGVEGGEEQRIWAVRADNEGCSCAGNILPWNVYGHAAGVGRRVTGRENQLCGVLRIRRAEGAGGARDSRIELAVGRLQDEVEDLSVEHVDMRERFGRGLVRYT